MLIRNLPLHIFLAIGVLIAPIFLIILSVSGHNEIGWFFDLSGYQNLFGNRRLADAVLATLEVSFISGSIGALIGVGFGLICYLRGNLFLAVGLALVSALIPGEATSLGFLQLESIFNFKTSSVVFFIWSLAHYSGSFAILLMAYVLSQTDRAIIRSGCDIGGSLLDITGLLLFHIHRRSVLAIWLCCVLLDSIEFPRTSILGGSTEYLSVYFYGRLQSGVEPSTFALAGATVLILLSAGCLVLLGIQYFSIHANNRVSGRVVVHAHNATNSSTR